jgi:iron complex outermembrane receptor protein
MPARDLLPASLIALAISLPCIAMAADLSGSASAAAISSELSEIVVTAQKREESAQNVGMSIQAATGDRLLELGVTDTAQLVKIIAGFNYTPTIFGTPVYSIRGVGYQDTALAGGPTVSIYLDEVPLPFSILAQGASLDLQRVEVLKGPQGTLFGTNATGGAVNYIANKPTDHFEAGTDLSLSRFNTIDFDGFVSGPISDTLRFRVAARILESGPWQYSYTHDASVGSQDFLNSRAALVWEPDNKFRSILTISAWRDRGETQMAQLFGFAPQNINNGVDPRIIGNGPYLDGISPISGAPGHYPFAPHDARAADWGQCVNTSPFDPPYDSLGAPYGYTPATGGPRPTNSTSCGGFHKDNVFYSASLRLDHDLGGEMRLTSLTTYEHFHRYQPMDLSGMIYQDFQSLARGSISTVAQEIRFAGEFTGKGNWLVGANYEHDSAHDELFQSYGNSSINPIFGMWYGSSRPATDQTTATYAVFGNVEYPVVETVTLQAGLRFTQSDKTFHGCDYDGGDGTYGVITQVFQNYLESANGYPSGFGVNPGPSGCATAGPPPTYNPDPTAAELNQNNVSWRVGVNWKPVSSTLLYANASQGWKSGSFPTLAFTTTLQQRPVVQEGLLAYEAGVKSTLLERTLTINAATFYYDYKNKQIQGQILDPLLGALSALVNVPRSHVVGLEASGAWQPARGLTITPAVSYSRSRVDGAYQNYDAFGVLSNFGGEPFPLAPAWQANLDTEYRWNISASSTAFVGANINHQGRTVSFFYNRDPAALYPSNALEIPEYTLLDLRAGLQTGPWRVQFWGRNVTNKYYWLSADAQGDVVLRYAGMPVTYGVTANYRYK